MSRYVITEREMGWREPEMEMIWEGIVESGLSEKIRDKSY